MLSCNILQNRKCRYRNSMHINLVVLVMRVDAPMAPAHHADLRIIDTRDYLAL